MEKNKPDSYGEIVTLLLKLNFVTDKQVLHAERIRSKLATPVPLLNVLKNLEVITDEMIRRAMLDSESSIRIGELLVELGYLSESDLTAAFNIQKEKESDLKIGEILIKYNFIDENLFNRILSIQLGIPLIDVNMSVVDKKQFEKIPLRVATEYNFVPILTDDDSLMVAFSDPLDNNSISVARKCLGSDFTYAIAEKQALQATVKLLANLRSGKKINVDTKTIVGIANSIILDALKNDASDVHIEPLVDRLQVRFREDGVLRHYKDFSIDIIPALTSRIKIMCEADIAEKRRHQGGRILFEHDEGQVDIRASFYVTVHGEQIVLRLLKQKKELMDIHSIGMSPNMLNRFLEDAVYQPSGVLLVTGPTGSGKTSTVYSCISHIKNPQISIITAEEPVEYVMDGIAQCSIDPKINLTFEETLRHIVRQDPDVIVIGEIRDLPSAEMAMQSALTGHKVLSTFHTEDSIGGLIRLLNMKIAPFLISSTVVSVLAQRLLRRVCPSCATDVKLTPQQLQRLGCNPSDLHGTTFKKGRGCVECKQTGYKGRVGVFELLVLNELVRDAILEQKTSYEIRQISIKHSGLVTLLEDGLLKAANGITSVD
ncbi:MAG: Flp pilus assembly complex ATPase component TadA, partial [Proteobacteria bacterium]|nr:Flp pilus assembly complex ATPase component TadA [Pseudomonadota bacterium]